MGAVVTPSSVGEIFRQLYEYMLAVATEGGNVRGEQIPRNKFMIFWKQANPRTPEPEIEAMWKQFQPKKIQFKALLTQFQKLPGGMELKPKKEILKSLSWTQHALDVLARYVFVQHPLEICVAACVHPSERGLLIATNCSGLTVEAVVATLTKLKRDVAEHGGFAFKYTQPELGVEDGKALIEKYAEVLTMLCSFNVTVVKGTVKQPVHAEVLLLDYLEGELNEPCENEVEVGISMVCCGKCSALFNLYKEIDARKVRNWRWRGTHGCMNQGWTLPKNLLQVMGTKPALLVEAKLLVFGEKKELADMHHEQSPPNSPRAERKEIDLQALVRK
jgi:hypothetical protein